MLLDKAKFILNEEVKSIQEMIKNLDENFDKAITIMQQCEGRIVVTGMGKPGIIAQKISATLSSTGVPSLFLHAAEAVHGDLGMVTEKDIVIILSNSGETEEVIKLIPILKKIGSKIISICGNAGSTLVGHSDCFLNSNVEREADSLDLIPSSSTTAMLAMGDAIALVFVEEKGLNKEDFAFYHPGGALGKRLLLTVGDIMRKGKTHAIVEEDQSVQETIFCITKSRAGSATIVDKDGALVGIFTDGDLRRHIETDPDLLSKKINTVMIKNPVVFKKEDLVAEALKVLQEKKIDEAPVVDAENKPEGLIDVQDILKTGIV